MSASNTDENQLIPFPNGDAEFDVPRTQMQIAWAYFYFGEERMNATGAARKAGYDYPNVQGPKNRKKFEDYIAWYFRRNHMTPEEVASELAGIARSDIGDVLNVTIRGTVTPKAWKSLREAGLTKLIKEIRETRHGIVIKMYDRVRALELIGRQHDMFGADTEVDISGKIEVEYVNDWRNFETKGAGEE